MKKQIVFTVILVLICSGSIFFGIYAYSLTGKNAEEVQEEVIEIIPEPEPEPAEPEPAAPVIKKKGPVTSLFFPDLDSEKGIQNALSVKSREVLGVWAVLKVINGVINVLQSAQIGGSFFVEASVNPLEFLAPIDNVLDKISNLLLWALGAILFEKILLAISGYVVFLVIIPLCVIIWIVTLWTIKDKTKIVKVIVVSVLISLLIPFAVPVSFQASALMEKKILTNNVDNLIASIQEKNSDAESMESEITALKRIGKSIMSYMANAKNLGNALIEDIMNYFILFIFTNIFIPIVTVLSLFFTVRFFVRILLPVKSSGRD